ncbi:CxxxxCH/CxxCH domain c-type cytochrome [Geobacter pickeringii]|uniref:Cytochrome C n=1 Tax=Geobacter pickeringii TaxID=345632 RepID=A0A0B5B7H3_9BACT|nr:CxxxxCH/CxxCH domain-containing protein [Geobacter pickeringii]AJE02507.1 cytochrome C [Geobacter pickeringii]
MEKRKRLKALRGAFAWAGALALLFAGTGLSHAASTCSDCHGMPPIDAAYRNITTGGFKGSHQTHQPAAAVAANCAVCHTGSATFGTDHMSGTITMSSNLNNSPVAAVYSKGVFFNQTSNPVLGSCSNVNCHFEKTTPIWASAKLVSPNDCGVCHGNPPSDGNHPSITGVGKKHGDYYGTGATSCVKCHVDHTVEASPFAHASSAGNRPLNLQFTAAPNTTGTYSKTTDLAYPTYLPSQTTAANRNGTCSAMYCHSDGAGGAAKTVATWGGTLPADCTGCHGGNATSASPIVSGLHTQHINQAAVLGTNFECARCHNGPVSAGNDRAITTPANHVNGTKTVSFVGGGTYNATAKTCATTVCHSSGKATAPQPAAPSWTGTALGCNGCHGTSNTLGTPDYPNGGPGLPLANSHVRHVAVAGDCDKCHTNTTTTGTAIKAGSTVHTNGAIDVNFNTAKAGTAATWTAATKSCTNVSCHGTAAPVWGGTLPTDCTGCHGSFITSVLPIASYSHPTHLSRAYGPGTYLGSTVTACQVCHDYNTVQPDPKHADGIVEVLNASGSACAKCHPGTLPTWSNSSRIACTACHAATPSVLPNGVAAAYKANFATTGHGQTFTNYSSSRRCESCHDANSAHISGVLGDNMRLLLPDDNTQCASCHNSAAKVPTVTKQNVLSHVTVKGGTPTSDCKSCHDVHGSTNLSMVKSSIGGKTITFSNFSSGFVKIVAPFDGLCQVCHTQTAHYKSGQVLDGHPTKNCLSCHGHKGGAFAFQPVTACDSCHGYPPLPTGYVNGTGNYANGKPEDYPGGGGAHVIARHVVKTAVPADGWTNCTICHGNGSLNPATHTMNLPVTPSKITIDVNDKYKFNHTLPLGPQQYSGKLLDGGANATGSCFNVNCHFKASKKWSTTR